ncbi:glycerol-3-phosphate cytidylyltransferase [Metapseudomonas resinovorans]|uniref:adenylyltransferase/cytidyltransferase family protein n=1 Tax=Metapseudomonas resinovorans TaxID=53412 RepID=UPI0009858892|nr:adenylyltransferase/cytidyltransferase family protein [Pseudomonas resinovorans]GLZ88429.1 glycerol-3-phosphate cytidylyltransferase [Pseudomonas resinovorans]
MKKIITYGTFDLFHTGHLKLLQRLKNLGDHLTVAVSTDEFNASKGKKTIIKFEDRIKIVSNIKCVDAVIAEDSWDQKEADIISNNISVFGMGSDWEGKFDDLNKYCKVVYLPRTEGISSTEIKKSLHPIDKVNINELKRALDIMSSIVEQLD